MRHQSKTTVHQIQVYFGDSLGRNADSCSDSEQNPEINLGSAAALECHCRSRSHVSKFGAGVLSNSSWQFLREDLLRFPGQELCSTWSETSRRLLALMAL